jgi:protein-S-isoprenylcysteine O-methyltransferase Ste14
MAVGKLLALLAVEMLVTLAVMALLLFLPAGSWRWPEGWAFLGVFGIGGTLFCLWLAWRDPGLLAERLKPPVQKDQPLWDRLFMLTVVTLWLAWLSFMALDAQRWHTSHMPVTLEVVGAVLIVAGFAAIMPVFAANSFAAPVVRVQTERNQHVIDTGPYAWVRHPMYSASILYMLGMPLLLGSWYGLIGSALIIFVCSFRAVGEERKLRDDLSGYADYMTRVRYRLIPGVW